MSNNNRNQPRGSTNKMLIDATHPEETRVVVLRNGRVEEFDYEIAARKLLRGNIYLAKVTRVEPSLQAAFVDYGGNRHGFLAFNEIHPDYYQIPVADRRALIEAEAAAEAEEEAAADAPPKPQPRAAPRRRRGAAASAAPSSDDGEDDAVDVTRCCRPSRDEARRHDDAADDDEPRRSPSATTSADARSPSRAERRATASRTHAPIAERADDRAREPLDDADRAASHGSATPTARRARRRSERSTSSSRRGDADGDEPVETVEAAAVEAEQVETVAVSEDALEEVPARPRRRLRSYKIQEVIKRRQVMLVQVVKEERGTKGAALTTYLSLAGRYTVLMPNTGARRRHLAQDHQPAGPQAPEGDRRRARRAGRHGPDHPHRRRRPHQAGDQARLRVPAAAVGERARPDAELDRARASSTRKAT